MKLKTTKLVGSMETFAKTLGIPLNYLGSLVWPGLKKRKVCIYPSFPHPAQSFGRMQVLMKIKQ